MTIEHSGARRRLQAGALGLCIAGLLVAACGSDNPEPSAASAASAAQTTDGASATTPSTPGSAEGTVATESVPPSTLATAASPEKSPIVVGNVGTYTGPASANFAGSGDVVAAWAKSVNAHGGINGHPVEVIVKDDAGDPAKALAAVQELVENDKVVALLGTASAADSAFSDYIKEKKVASISALTGTTDYAANPSAFLIGASIRATAWGRVSILKNEGLTKFGVVVCAESPGCQRFLDLIKPLAESEGMEYVFDGAAAAADPDYTALCIAAQQAGAEGLVTATILSVWVRLAQSCAQQDYHPILLLSITGDPTSALAEPAMEGSLPIMSVFPGFVDDPATAEYRDAVATYLPDRTVIGLASAGAGGWISGKLFEAAVKDLADDFTAADFFTGLYGLKDETLGGLATAPLNFEPGKGLAGVDCVYWLKISDDTLVAPDGLESKCMPSGS